jgi:CRP-like cAMP-binding protein
MYFVVAGRVGLCRDTRRGRETYFAQLGPGDCFGDMDMIDDLPRAFAARALETTDGLLLTRQKLLGPLMAYPELSLGMVRALSRRMRQP